MIRSGDQMGILFRTYHLYSLNFFDKLSSFTFFNPIYPPWGWKLSVLRQNWTLPPGELDLRICNSQLKLHFRTEQPFSDDLSVSLHVTMTWPLVHYKNYQSGHGLMAKQYFLTINNGPVFLSGLSWSRVLTRNKT